MNRGRNGGRCWRRLGLFTLALLALPIFLSSCLVTTLGGNFDHDPAELATGLSSEARALVDRAFDGIEGSKLLDYHTHACGTGSSDSGIFINKQMQSPVRHPIKYTKYKVFMSACCVHNVDQADTEYLERFHDLCENMPHAPWGKHLLFAFDKHYRKDGTVDLERTEFYIPNDYVLEQAAARPDRFIPVMSVHPYRADAVAELERCAQLGVRFVKWLPNAMNIDPADPICDPFYAKMREHKLILISHAGKEMAVHAADKQELGNPLRLRRALDAGVRVVIAHCGSLGYGLDLDHGDQPEVPNFELFIRLMDDERYEGLVFGELSAITQMNRVGSKPRPLQRLLERTDLHDRLVNGSDYPVPAVNCVIWTKTLAKYGFITKNERKWLNEIYSYNPLLFDFVTKRTLRGRKGERWPAHVYYEHPDLQ